jgi:phosphoserine phosphatase
MDKLVLIDCDSTLSAIEGIDELARLRGDDTFRAVEEMTRAAMEGGVSMESVFSRRLALIAPLEAELASIGQKYIETVESTALETVRVIQQRGWVVVIVSGGFTQAIRPLADYLGIERVEAVTLLFDDRGQYAGFEEGSPTAQTKGKNMVARRLRAQFAAQRLVMVGDGASDLEVKEDVDWMVGFGGFAVRERVKSGADAFIYQLRELPQILDRFA